MCVCVCWYTLMPTPASCWWHPFPTLFEHYVCTYGADIAAPKPSFRNHLYSFNSQTLYHGNDKRLSYLWRSFDIPEKVKNLNLGQNKMRCRGLLIKAVATLEPKCSTESNVRDDYNRLHLDSSSKSPQVVKHQSSNEDDSTELDKREKLRRMRISKANKGNTPWNKGRKHTPGSYIAISNFNWIKLWMNQWIYPPPPFYLFFRLKFPNICNHVQKPYKGSESEPGLPCRILRWCHVRIILHDSCGKLGSC